MADQWKNRIVGHGEVRAADFLANPLNWRIHPSSQQSALKGSLDELGWIDEVTVNQRTNFIVDGHLRVMVALREGDDIPVPVRFVDLSTAEERLALASKDPMAALAITDTEKLDALLQDTKPADAALQQFLSELAAKEGIYQGNGARTSVDEIEPHIDRAAELQQQWGTALGQLWVIESKTVPGKAHRLLCGDSRDVAQIGLLLQDTSPHLLLTDPPYGISVVKVHGATDGGSKPVTMGHVRSAKPYPSEGVRQMTATIGGSHLVDATPYRPVFGDDAPFDPSALLSVAHKQIIFGGNYFASKLPDSRCWIVWDKQNTGNFADAELAWTSFDRGVRLYQFLWNGLSREGSRTVEGFYRVHPTQKPAGLFRQILEDFSEPGASILDLYVGSGTTLVACELSGRLGYGCEIDPAYVAVTLDRLKTNGLTPRLVEL